jgi:hypothetical protein
MCLTWHFSILLLFRQVALNNFQLISVILKQFSEIKKQFALLPTAVALGKPANPLFV